MSERLLSTICLLYATDLSDEWIQTKSSKLYGCYIIIVIVVIVVVVFIVVVIIIIIISKPE